METYKVNRKMRIVTINRHIVKRKWINKGNLFNDFLLNDLTLRIKYQSDYFRVSNFSVMSDGTTTGRREIREWTPSTMYLRKEKTLEGRSGLLRNEKFICNLKWLFILSIQIPIKKSVSVPLPFIRKILSRL